MAWAGALCLQAGCASPAAVGGQTPPTPAVANTPAPVPPPLNVQWARALGGDNRDFGATVAVAPDGRVFVGGHFTGGTADARGRVLTSAGASDAVLFELNAAGTLAGVRVFGGPSAEEIKALAVGAGGELYLAGLYTDRVDFDPGPGRAELVAAGSADAFVVRLETDGSLGWARSVGGAFGDVALGLAARPGGGVLVAGYFQGAADLDPGAGEAIFTSAGRTDAFALALDAAGDFVWATAFGGEGDDEATGIAPRGVGSEAGAIVAGQLTGTAGFSGHEAPAALASAGATDAFAAGIDGRGTPEWALRLGGPGKDGATAIAALPGGGAVVAGFFLEEATAGPGRAVVSAGRNDVFVLTVGGDGAVRELRHLGGPGDDFTFGVAAAPDGVYVSLVSQDLPDPAANRGPSPTASHVVRLAPGGGGGDSSRRTFTADGGIQILDLALAPDGSLVAAGTFQGEAALDAGEPRAITSAGKTDAFAARLAPPLP